MLVHFVSEIPDSVMDGIGLVRPLVAEALRVVEGEFTDLDAPALLGATEVEVRLLAHPTRDCGWDQMRCSMKVTPPRIEAIAPTAHPDVVEAAFPLDYDRLWYLKNFIHECTALFLWLYRPSTPAWSLREAPEWFVEGIEEYVAIERSVPEIRDRYRSHNLRRLLSNTVQNRFSAVANNYADGYLIVLFMHERYGATQVHRVLNRTSALLPNRRRAG